ncbi:P-loop containing nucleoside triphosphate hydrolase protein [Choiromyces venosus 120613-1]|uniref:P-loop containing nucleoside triphosphate hydrolase protein n=1 Tax=Choiromyces venosus 120613-1 TaxID=1336337 RepID=A0A3N4JMQ2_9PEZI|nr:P-loop containing nucleoside triphosphate hydrolase protein [Choiromyces venosus 120613-1]
MSDPEKLDPGKELGKKTESQDSELTIGVVEDEPSRKHLDSDSETASGQEHETHISFHEVHAVDVAVRNLTIAVSQHKAMGWVGGLLSKKGANDEEAGSVEEVKILDNISADMPAGELVAIIGGSGSGKTSMLNAMSSRMTGSNLHITGTTTFNNSNPRYAYVMQQDVLLPTLTVRETLMYSAELRLPENFTQEERAKIVEEVILQLGLKECADTRIGNNEHKGCSGGEKRRVSIGVQLLSNPSVLFLDEPTTGLDATSAYQVVRTLKNLARKGRTVITTIHQPRSEIWGLFDRITLLTKGKPMYGGKRDDVLSYFASLGYPFPEHVNPADFLIDLSAIDFRTPEAEEASIVRIGGLVDSWREEESSVLSRKNTAAAEKHRKDRENEQAGNTATSVIIITPSLSRQISVLTRRSLKTTYRDPLGIAGTLGEAISMAIVAGWIFYHLDHSLSGIRSRQGALYIAASLQSYLILLFETYRLSEIDVKLFDRERGEGVVGVLGFLTSRRISRLPEDISVPLFFSVIFYFMCGFDSDAKQFFTFFAVVLIAQYLAVTFATVCVGVSRDFSQAVLVANLWFTMQSMACGYFVQAATMPVYVRWTKYISYAWYSFGALSSNEFTDKFFACPLPDASPANRGCLEYVGNFVLESLDFSRDWIKVPVVINVCWVLLYYLVAGLFFKFKPVDISISSARPRDEKDTSAGKEKMGVTKAGTRDTRDIEVVLDNIRLKVEKPEIKIIGKKGLDLEILKGVSTRFEPGKLNVIMGPSGSGKSSLLNLMARRLHSSASTRYKSSGKMFFNGALPSDTVIKSLCSYVTQDDDALLPSLTVRETLYYAAQLRLPSSMSKSEKKRRADDVILKMGLRDCADNLIGSEFLKGISGGEKRRVTIAVQILMEPRILLLDEPTSGLDAFTAASILGVLKGLAEEGRTIISTIHQSRSDLFKEFGNVILLARGGHVVYSGRANQMLPYFSSLSHECPATTNPADFALDLVTVDLQQPDREAATRVVVERLIGRFDHKEALDSKESERKIALPAELGSMKREKASFMVAYPILVSRGLLNLRRQPMLVIARIMQVIGLGIVVTLYFAPLGNDYISVQNRLGFIQQILPVYFVGMLQNVALYPLERDVFYREHDDRTYGVTAFFLAYLTNELPSAILTAHLFAALAVFAVGLPRTIIMFYVMTYNTFCIVSCGESLGIFFNTLFRHTGFSVNVTSTILCIAVFMSGIMSIDVPAPLEAFNYLSPLKYATRSLTPYSLDGVVFTCTQSQRLPSGNCPIDTGKQALQLYGLDVDPKWNLVVLAAVTVIYRIVAFAMLKLQRMQLGVGKLKEL